MSRGSSGNGKISRINKTGLTFGLVTLIIFIVVRLFCDNSYEMIHKFDTSDIIPPLWLLNLLTFVWGFLIGYAAGSVIDCVMHSGASINLEIAAYRGGLFFLTLFFLSQTWYCIFFQGGHLFIALLIIVIALLSSIICAYFWYSALKTSALIIGAYCIWLFYLIILNASVLLHI